MLRELRICDFAQQVSKGNLPTTNVWEFLDYPGQDSSASFLAVLRTVIFDVNMCHFPRPEETI